MTTDQLKKELENLPTNLAELMQSERTDFPKTPCFFIIRTKDMNSPAVFKNNGLVMFLTTDRTLAERVLENVLQGEGCIKSKLFYVNKQIGVGYMAVGQKFTMPPQEIFPQAIITEEEFETMDPNARQLIWREIKLPVV